MSNSSPSQHVLIIGGGIAGPALALFLKKAGMTSAIYEAYPHLDDIGGGLQIAPNGMRVLQELNLAKKIIENGYYVPEFRFRNPQGKLIARFKNGRVEKDGQPAIGIARPVFHQILLEEVERQGIRVEYQKRLKAISYNTPGQVTAHFEDGTTALGDFLVGADGIRSITRELILPDGPKPAFTGFLNIGGFAAQSVVPSMTPEERQSINMTFGPEGHFGYLKGNQDEIMWWSNPPSDKELTKEELANLSTEQVQREMFATFKGWHEPIEAILQNTSLVVRTNMYDIPNLPVWHKNRVVLIGDAAHAMSPTSGQGASVALEDAMYLAKLLRQTPHQLSKVFTQFEQERRPRVEAMIAQARRNNKNKMPASPLAAWFRNQMMGIFMSLFGERSLNEAYRYTIKWDDQSL